jgi:Raf kinase inhibitor-like YbhB/YbcL family protein
MRAAALVLTATAFAAPAPAMDITSPDIQPNAPIAAAQIYPRCGGQNVSPGLAWSGAPAGTAALVLTMIDVDAKPSFWSHWIVVGLPPATTSLPRGAAALPPGAHAVASNFGDAAYGGPCPPAGSGVHHYQFTIWAMPSAAISIGANAPATEVLSMLQRTSSAHATLVGTAQR